MAIVTKPKDKGTQSKVDLVFRWDLQGAAHISSKVIVGSSAGAEDYYIGTEKSSGTYTDDKVVGQPGGNKTCYTRPKYRKVANGPWYTTLSLTTSFVSTD